MNMSTNLIEFHKHHVHVTLEKAKDTTMPALDIMTLHKQLHDTWRWYGIKPELRRLYELWAEIEAEDKAKLKQPRRMFR